MRDSRIKMPYQIALFNLGFRPFFLGAAVYSIITIGIWMGVYAFGWNIKVGVTGISYWHAHEMIYGYSLAVIAGFLLTAVNNWTQIQTICGSRLAVLFFFWVAARLVYIFSPEHFSMAAFFDISFILYLNVAIWVPVVRTRNWRQMGILSKLLLLSLANLIFYLGCVGIIERGIYWGIYGGFYLVLSLILMMGGRVIPFFMERGVGYPVKLYNPTWISVVGLILFLMFVVSELFLENKSLTLLRYIFLL